MSTGISYAGHTVAVGDECSPFGIVSSVSGSNVTYGPSLSGAGKTTPVAGDPVTVHSGVAQSISGSGGTANVTLKLGDGTTIVVNAQDCFNNE
jgi:hypothetical protein